MLGTVMAVMLAAAPPARDAAEEAAFAGRYEAVATGLGAVFTTATQAIDADRLDDAATGFERLTRDAPRLSAAFRRLSYVRWRQDRDDEAVSLAQTANELEPNVDNELAVLRTLSKRNKGNDAQVVLERADRLVRSPTVVYASDDWEAAKSLACVSAARTNRHSELVICANELLTAKPDSTVGNLIAAQVALSSGDFALARARLEKARPQLSAEEFSRYADAIDSAEPVTERYGRTLGFLFATWVLVFIAMAILGGVMSALTLRIAERLATSRERRAGAGAAVLRGAYRVVIGLGAVYYYVSLPLIALTLIIVFGGFVYMALVLGHVPIKLLIIAVVVGGGSLIALVRSLFVRSSDEDPGLELDLAQQPRLRAMLESVAARVGTRGVDHVFLTPGTELAVFERGTLLQRLRGRGKRCLIVGRGVLDGFKVGGFRSVLAHEFGHFSNEDTAGGGAALVARQSLLHMGIALATSGVAGWYNPAWWFFRAYWWTYLRISQGASRLQEVLADRVAIFSFGSAAFANGYRHVLEQSVRFGEHANRSIKQCVEGNEALPNLYRFVPNAPAVQEEVERAITEALEREAEPFDSHPSSKSRLGWAASLAVQIPEESIDRENVLTLFENLEPLEREMTERVRMNLVVEHDLMLPNPEAEAPK